MAMDASIRDIRSRILAEPTVTHITVSEIAQSTGLPERGRAANSRAWQSRARQNVVFELGYFIGRIQPERVVALIKGEIERPSDFDGVVYISLEKDDWRTLLAKEFKAAGLQLNDGGLL